MTEETCLYLITTTPQEGAAWLFSFLSNFTKNISGPWRQETENAAEECVAVCGKPDTLTHTPGRYQTVSDET